MAIENLVLKNRSYRRFNRGAPVERRTLRQLVNLARLSPSAANLQPLKYILTCSPQKNSLIYPCLSWAGYLKDWAGPKDEERPSAYIILLGDKEIKRDFSFDAGIAAQSIMLGAVEKGLGGCIIESIDRDSLRDTLRIPSRYVILLVLALGVPGEDVILETVSKNGDVRYWRDSEGRHHVPKRRIEDIIVEEYT